MEFFDVINERTGEPTGVIVPREVAHREGICHRTAQVWVTRERDGVREVLLQRRSVEKDSFPGLFDTSAAGHVSAGDEPLETAVRELGEELGIEATADQLSFAGTFRIGYEDVFHDCVFRDNEIAYVYAYLNDVAIEDLTLQEEEVSEVRWFTFDEVWEAVQTADSRFCVPAGGLKALRRALDEIG